MASQARLAANARYREKAYDVISFSVKKGKKEDYKQAAEQRGMSLAGILQSGVEEYIANHPVEGKE